ncbi:MAG TPA: hypothetical protein PKA55_14640 [Rhodoblastus sp.]|nr:hypothetical protein [Rhodoblastus sp.]
MSNHPGVPRRVLASILLILGVSHARAHDFWIDGSKVDPVTKSFCCGAGDCRAMPKEMVKVERGGYRLLDTNELIPFLRAQPSPDGEYWVCRWGAETKCFFGGEIF